MVVKCPQSHEYFKFAEPLKPRTAKKIRKKVFVRFAVREATSYGQHRLKSVFTKMSEGLTAVEVEIDQPRFPPGPLRTFGRNRWVKENCVRCEPKTLQQQKSRQDARFVPTPLKLKLS